MRCRHSKRKQLLSSLSHHNHRPPPAKQGKGKWTPQVRMLVCTHHLFNPTLPICSPPPSPSRCTAPVSFLYNFPLNRGFSYCNEKNSCTQLLLLQHVMRRRRWRERDKGGGRKRRLKGRESWRCGGTISRNAHACLLHVLQAGAAHATAQP